MKEMRIKNLRKVTVRGTEVPNIKSKLWALRLQDELSNNEAIKLPEVETEQHNASSQHPEIPPMQSNSLSNYAVVGTDVEALFPSLMDIEAARITREAVMRSNTEFKNVDLELALRYLVVTGGQSHLRESGLSRLVPRWTGPRPDLLTVGGTSMEENEKWTRVSKVISEREKRMIISRVLETAVIVCMNTHIYRFGPDLFLQKSGGPIGMRFTAALANIVMKMWDFAWVSLMKREKIVWDLYLRYVDDCRLFVPVLNKGWHWDGKRFRYSSAREEADNRKDCTDEHRTTEEMAAAMSSLVGFLRFTGEDKSMFSRGNLPTLDTALWLENNQIKFEFFEKPTCGNQVVHRETALPKSCIDSTLVQETVRRLKNCSRDINPAVRSEMLSNLANKMINSGHGLKETKKMIVKGTAKYIHLLECSEKDENDPNFKPLYLWKEYGESERQVRKYLARMGWYRKSDERDCEDLGNTETVDLAEDCTTRACPAKYKDHEASTEDQAMHHNTRACPAKYYNNEASSEDQVAYHNTRACPAKYNDSVASNCEENTVPTTRACPAKYNESKEVLGRTKKINWRDRLKGSWKDSRSDQRCVEGMKFSTIMQVQSSKGGRLLREMIRIESSLARVSGYNVKYVEKSGVPLARLFQRVFSDKTCHWDSCPTCKYSDSKKSSRCRTTNIVYEATCLECKAVSGKNAVGLPKYIRESSRTLAERSKEHTDGAANCEYDNFIVKHWVTTHRELSNPPRMCFKVLKSFQDALSRLATESVYIDAFGSMNSKSEYRNNKISRIVIEDPRSKHKGKGQSEEDDEDNILKNIDLLRTKVEERKKEQRVAATAGDHVLRNKESKKLNKISFEKRKLNEGLLDAGVANKRIKLSEIKKSTLLKSEGSRLGTVEVINEKQEIAKEGSKQIETCLKSWLTVRQMNTGKRLELSQKEPLVKPKNNAVARAPKEKKLTAWFQQKDIRTTRDPGIEGDALNKSEVTNSSDVERKKKVVKKMKQVRIDCSFNKTARIVNVKRSLTITDSNQDLCCRYDPARGIMPNQSKRTGCNEKEEREEKEAFPIHELSTPAEEVGESRRDYAGPAAPADLTGAPSTSGMTSRDKKKVLKKKKEKKAATTDSDEADSTNVVTRVKVRSGKVTRRGKITSTPVTIGKGRMRKNPRMTKKKTVVGGGNLERVKRKLDSGRLVSLSPSSSNENLCSVEFESTGSSLREALAAGEIDNIANIERDSHAKYDDKLSNNERDSHAKYNPLNTDDERACPAKYNVSSERAFLAKYDTSDMDNERECLAKYKSPEVGNGSSASNDELATYKSPEVGNGSSASNDELSWMNSSDPAFEKVILGLTDRDKIFNNPFQLTRHIQEMMRLQAEQAGSRAMSWSLPDFDKVGGRGSLRAVWEELKSEERVRGMKRSVSSDEEESDEFERRKKLCVSLNISNTCLRIRDIGLRSTSSEECESIPGERESNDTDTDLDVSYLLDKTRDDGVVVAMINGARNLIREAMEGIPDLTSSSESVDNTHTDSGNSETHWGWNEFGIEEGEMARGPRGELVPVTHGNSSVSDTSEECHRVLSQMNSMPDSNDELTEEEFNCSDRFYLTESTSSEDEVWVLDEFLAQNMLNINVRDEAELIMYRDDGVIMPSNDVDYDVANRENDDTESESGGVASGKVTRTSPSPQGRGYCWC